VKEANLVQTGLRIWKSTQISVFVNGRCSHKFRIDYSCEKYSDADIGLADRQYRPEKVAADVQMVGFVEMNISNDIFIDERKQKYGHF
jgi:hypothetical protein